MKKDDGGQAFPCAPGPDVGVGMPAEYWPGMSLRDYFAATAMGGWIASYAGSNAEIDMKKSASLMYRVADAMLAEREKDGTE